ncbi:hypothetical protein C8Q78DRAFT_988889 [Trametes maxima]|nr:hypothetical protein C8Q78DRAFT_988889 [Trametes maxima]
MPQPTSNKENEAIRTHAVSATADTTPKTGKRSSTTGKGTVATAGTRTKQPPTQPSKKKQPNKSAPKAKPTKKPSGHPVQVENSGTSTDNAHRAKDAATKAAEKEISTLRAKLLREEAARKKAEAEVEKMKKRTRMVKKLKTIPKPPGSVGKGLKLRDEMHLQGNKPLYLNCLMTVRDLCLAGRLDWKRGIREQDASKLGALYEIARAEQPYLARFENDWATAQILIQFMANRRKNAIRKGRVIVTKDDSGRHVLKDVRVVGKVRAERGDAEGSDEEEDGGSDEEDDLDEGFLREDEDIDEDEDEEGAALEYEDEYEVEPEDADIEAEFEDEVEEARDEEDAAMLDQQEEEHDEEREGRGNMVVAAVEGVGGPGASAGVGKSSRASRSARAARSEERSDELEQDTLECLPPAKRRKIGQVKGVSK